MPKTTFQQVWIRYIAFWGIAFIMAVALFSFARNLTICWRITAIPGLPPSSCDVEEANALQTPIIAGAQATLQPTATAVPNPFEDIEYPTWDGGSRINILFVGFRGGDPREEDCPFCTDTLMLMTVDPITKTAGILSIPRDLWVNIPGFGYSRINTAWTLGRGSKLPGGGPALTMKTVSHVIGVPVNYYVQVDFDTFIDIIDLLGGVDIYNDESLVLDPVAHGKDYPKVKLNCCGIRHLQGRIALAYVRCRHEEKGCKDGDIGRARRQQKIIFAIRDKVLDPANFPTLMALAPPLYGKFSEGIHTNLSLEDGLRLAVLVKDIPKENIKNKVIDGHMVIGDSVILGGLNASILRPLPDQIRVVRDEVFTASGPVSPLAHEDLFALAQADGARIRLLNGTSAAELDTRTENYLSQKGFQITELGKAKLLSRTTIILYSPKLYAFKYLLDVFGIDHSTQILVRPDPSQTVDIEIRLGQDWATKLPADFPD